MLKTIYNQYAKLLINYSLKLKEGERLLIESSYLAEPLVKEIFREALITGALPETSISINDLEWIKMHTANDGQLKDISPITKLISEKYDALAIILAPFNIKNINSISLHKKRLFKQARDTIMKTRLQRAAAGQLKWILCQYPVDAAAQAAGMSLEEYEDFIFKACYLYDDDPIAKWGEVHSFQENITGILNKKEKIEFNGPDIDISFSTKERVWINADGTNNMPSGEIFTAPVENSVNGKIRFSYPGFYMGQEIDDICLEVKKGEIVTWTAGKGKTVLDSLFKIPGTRRFGEAAIGTNKGIQTFTGNMLFDEKMDGTIHMAIGSSYPETGGKNTSPIHWDLLTDMRNGGNISADGEKIYENGSFLI